MTPRSLALASRPACHSFGNAQQSASTSVFAASGGEHSMCFSGIERTEPSALPHSLALARPAQGIDPWPTHRSTGKGKRISLQGPQIRRAVSSLPCCLWVGDVAPDHRAAQGDMHPLLLLGHLLILLLVNSGQLGQATPRKPVVRKRHQKRPTTAAPGSAGIMKNSF